MGKRALMLVSVFEPFEMISESFLEIEYVEYHHISMSKEAQLTGQKLHMVAHAEKRQ